MGTLENKWLKHWSKMQKVKGCKICPRCGSDVNGNAEISRFYNIQICSKCKTEESKDESLEDWWFAN